MKFNWSDFDSVEKFELETKSSLAPKPLAQNTLHNYESLDVSRDSQNTLHNYRLVDIDNQYQFQNTLHNYVTLDTSRPENTLHNHGKTHE